ncbi:MAG TPA: ATP-binding protein [Edaphobacter sp.]|nr:ATP-binding protein [Edaphobacter sp.]
MNVQHKVMPGRVPSLSKLPAETVRRLRGVASGATTAAVSSTLLLTGSSPSTTAAAEVLAHETGREVVRVDLSKLVSQYVGETEKNIDRLFATVDPARTILFFDEADALFGKRTSVKESHDRYDGADLSWLLERIEPFPTLAVFARRAANELPPGCHFCNNIRLPD